MATTFQPKTEPSLVGLPPNTTLLEFGRWLKGGGPDVDAHMAWVQSLGAEVGMQHLATMEAAVELAETSTDAASYLTDPVGWIERYVEFPRSDGLAEYQSEALAELGTNGRLALRGPRGLGKSTIGALSVLWFALTRDAAGIDWKIATTASVGRQLKEFLWPEIHKWSRLIRWDELGRAPLTPYELLDMRLKLDYGNAWAQAAHDPNTIEGAHARHLFYLYDESKSIPVPMWDSAEGAFANAGPETGDAAWFLALSVPGPPNGRFYDIHSRKRGMDTWKVIHVTKERAIRAGRMKATWPDEMRALWGENSALYQQHVEGNFAASATDAVIPLEWVEAAVERWHALAESGADLGPIVSAGLDIGRSGGDETVLAMSTRDCVLPLVRPNGKTAPILAAQVKAELSQYPGRPVVMVDADGLGAGYFDTLKEGVDWVDRIYPFHAQNKAISRDYTNQLTLANARSLAWWSLRDELNPHRLDHTPTLALPPDSMLIGDLTTPTYRGVEAGKIFIQLKEEIRKQLDRSTDAGDAVVQARYGLRMAARATVTAAQHKARPGTHSSGDLRRGADAAGPESGNWSPLKVSW